MTLLSACVDEAASTMALTLREMEFSTRRTWSAISASEVAPNSPIWSPQSFPAFCEPASIACQNAESVALTITSIFLPEAGTLPLPLAELAAGAKMRPPRIPSTRAISAAARRTENEKELLKTLDMLNSFVHYEIENTCPKYRFVKRCRADLR